MSHAVSSDGPESARRHHRVTTPIDSLIVMVSERIGGGQAKEIERFIKFAFVGFLGFVIDSGTLLILQNTVLPPVNEASETLAANVAISTTVAFILAVCSNFAWNRLWTYPDSRSYSVHRQLTQFVIVSIVGWAVRTALIYATYKLFGELSTSVVKAVNAGYAPALLDQDKLGSMIALFLGVIVVMLWNFLANRYWTYNDVA